MPIVIDGNNLLHRLPADQRSRDSVRQRVLDQARREKISLTVVFDGPPPEGSPSTEHLGSVTILYSGHSSADDIIIGRLPSGASARSWSVVTDDRGLAARVREQGASVRTLATWMGRRGAKRPPGRPRPEPRTKDLDQWESFFKEKDDANSDQPKRVFKPKKGRK